jgi:hypothetical protein
MIARVLRMFVLAMALPGVAVAQTAAECGALAPEPAGENGFMTHAVPADIGGGWVAQDWAFDGDVGGQTGVDLMHCETDNMLRVVERATGPDGAVVQDATIDAEAVFRAAVASPDVISIDDIVAGFREGGASVAPMEPDGRENCGCAVFYPEARGDKRAWAEWSAQ